MKVMSKTKHCDSLIEGLNEAISFANGKETGAIVHQIEVVTTGVGLKSEFGCIGSENPKGPVAKKTL